MKYTTKKGQMEIMGLAVIVVLLAFGMYAMTKFNLLSGDTATTQEITVYKQVANDFINTFLKSNANCSGSYTFTDLIADIQDPSGYLDCGEDSYAHLNQSVRQILNKTIDKWNYEYVFNVTYPNSAKESANERGVKEINLEINHNCDSDMQKEAVSVPFRETYGVIYVTMSICHK